ncbi:MAG TPA: pyridoxamine 5'-phosphate oxidase family protein [Thermomicrobiales bacterium]|jgi:general stress protein 26
MMSDQKTQEEGRKKIGELIKDIQFAMLTTVEPDGTIRSRPMATQKQEFDGDLWFFTGASSPKVSEIRADSEVNVSFADPANNAYVSVSGTAQLVRDRRKIEELWNPILKAWFPDGLDDPDLALLKVTATQAEYWDSPNGKVVQALGFAKALLTGKQADGGENEKVSLAD